jgi:hypothetical protein
MTASRPLQSEYSLHSDSALSCSSQESGAALKKGRNSIIILACRQLIYRKRAPPSNKREKPRERRHPNHVIQALINNNKLFSRDFWMSYKSFNKLYSFLYSDLKAKAKCTRSDAIHLKTKLLVSLRYFAGGSHLNLIRIHGIGRTM